MLTDIETRLASLTFSQQSIQSLGAKFIFDVSKLLESLGYVLKPEDDWLLGFTIQKVENSIKNDCNVSVVPDGLYYSAVNMTVGNFLFSLKSSGKLLEFNFEAAIKQIQEGDTSITFAIGDGSTTPEKRFDSLISYLMNFGKGEFASHRCIKW